MVVERVMASRPGSAPVTRGAVYGQVAPTARISKCSVTRHASRVQHAPCMHACHALITPPPLSDAAGTCSFDASRLEPAKQVCLHPGPCGEPEVPRSHRLFQAKCGRVHQRCALLLGTIRGVRAADLAAARTRRSLARSLARPCSSPERRTDPSVWAHKTTTTTISHV